MPSAPCGRVRATFFVLGWIAEKYPQLIREIHQSKYEIASHGYDHRLIYNTSPNKFREDVRKSKEILEDIIGEEVIGYRAPSYSITSKSQWAFEVLMEEGFKYDSSIFPIHHDFYGFPEAPRFPFLISMNGNNNFEFSLLNLDLEITPQSAIRNPHSSTQSSVLSPSCSVESSINAINSNNSINPSNPAIPHSSLDSKDFASNLKRSAPLSSNDISVALSALCSLRYASSIVEFPLSTVRFCGQNLPISGGGYFRLFPYPFIKRGLQRINRAEGMPFIFYLHPWELDPDQPRMNSISRKSRFRHYVNLNKTEARFKKLLMDFEFSSIKDLLKTNVRTS
jgi:hypothetical protein